jgi:hypothetical protein
MWEKWGRNESRAVQPAPAGPRLRTLGTRRGRAWQRHLHDQPRGVYGPTGCGINAADGAGLCREDWGATALSAHQLRHGAPAPSACSERQMDRARILAVIFGVLVGVVFTVLLVRIVGVPF